MAKNLEPISFDLARFGRELTAFGKLLRANPGLTERAVIQPFFETHRQLASHLSLLSSGTAPATELAFQFPFFGDYSADVVLGSKAAGEFCVVEFEDGTTDSIFKRQPKRGNPEWSARFEHGFSQLVD